MFFHIKRNIEKKCNNSFSSFDLSQHEATAEPNLKRRGDSYNC